MTEYCRLCTSIKEINELFNILDPVHQITSKVLKLCQINLNEFDYLPQNCCSTCLDTLNRCIQFIEKCSAAQDILKQAFAIKVEQNFIKIHKEVADEKLKAATPSSLISIVPEETIQKDPTSSEQLDDISDIKSLNQQDHYNRVTAEEWLVCVEVNSTDGIVDEDSLINDEFDPYIPETLNTTVEVTVESSSPLGGTSSNRDETIEDTRNEDGSLPDVTSDSWNEYQWSCFKCQNQFESVTELREHFKIHQQLIKYHCIDCNKICIKYVTFLNHVRRRHRPHLKLCCDICSKFFSTGKLYRNHRFMHLDDYLTFNCSICQKPFRTNSALHAHIKTHFSPDDRDTTRCDICDKSFDLPASLLIHKRIHADTKNFTCDQCGKSFIQKGNLESHLLTHVPLQPFSCNVCKKAFKTQARLTNHMTVHSGLKPHKCDICGRQFREKGTLREHLRIHTGAMPFACEFCDKRFRFKGILTTHRRQHTGERPYSCLDCNHHFTNWPNFNKHMKRRHGINTCVSTRRPQAIPPSGMPPQSKLNFVVPTVDNRIELKEVQEIEENEILDEPVSGTFFESDVDEVISGMQQIIEDQQLQVERNETPSLVNYTAMEPPALIFYNMQS